MADDNGGYELHVRPGEGIVDRTDVFRRVEVTDFAGHRMNAFGSLEDMPRGREHRVARFPTASGAVEPR